MTFYCAWASWNGYFQSLFPEHKVKPLYNANIPKDAELIIFPGGEDINPNLYSKEPLRIHYNPRRDEQEIAIFEEVCDKTDIPILGVCRGHQLINVLLGGKLIPDLPSAGIIHGGGHPADWSEDFKFLELDRVNSLHHQGYNRSMTSKRLRSIAVHQGIVEAAVNFDNTINKIFTVQFHPEMMNEQKVVNLKNYVLSLTEK